MSDIFKYEPHGPWLPITGTGKLYCLGCGLVKLNNNSTGWCIDKGCNYKDHPMYLKKMRKGM